ncbi:MAG: efflux transporter outer membrane subunit [Candidatus Omnitrophica bacterium]|nr:efflux transporter outer membrane subunit [Candidatus Omnitrophota bacterium]
MKISEFSIKRPIFASMLSVALVIFGVIGLSRLPVRELPDIDPPIVNVQTVYKGASAAVMETQVTELVEAELMSIDGIRTITSESREQVSSITVEFTLTRPIDVVAQDVRDRVSRVRGKLPKDIDEPIVAKQEADASPVLWIALYSDRYSTLQLTKMAEDLFKDRLQTVNGVSSIIFGGQKRFAIRLRLDAQKMASRGISVLDVDAALKRENIELPSGLAESQTRSLSIETKGQMKTPDEYNNLVIKRVGDTVIRFSDIGQAVIGVEDERSIARFNSKPALGIGVIKQSKANTIEVVKQIKKEVDRIRPSLPLGVTASFPYDESIYVEKAISEVWTTLGIAFILVVLTIFMFLRNLRSTFIPAIVIPVAIIATFGVLYGMGFSINIVTMLGLILAIGLVVDDAIIVLENIYRHIEAGMKPLEAAIQGMREIGFVVIATTITLVCVFMPMAFQTSVTGRFFIEFAVAISFSVLISAFVALTLTPTLAARILKPIHDDHEHKGILAAFERFFANLDKRYAKALSWSLRHPMIVSLVATAAILSTVFIYFRLDHEFVPIEDKGRFLIFALAPEGSTSEYTDRMVRKMEGIIAQMPETQEYFSAVALARGSPGNPAQGLAFIRLKEDRKRNLRDIVGGPKGLGGQLFTQVQGAFAIPIMPKSFGGGFTQPFELVIQSQDLVKLNNYAASLVNKLRKAGFLINVRSNFELNKPELRLSIDRDRAAQLGVSVEDIAKTLQIAFGGLDISKVNIDGKQYDVIAQLVREQRLVPTDLNILFIRNNKGELVQLSNLVNFETGAGPSAINHYNRFRSAVIEGTPTGVPLGTAMSKVEEILKKDLPSDFRYEWKGEAKELVESSQGIYFVMILALIVIYIVLAMQFESLIHPITVMFTLPLAAFGAFGALLIFALFKVPSMGVNLYSQIGMILLFGLVTKNAIMLVDFANQEIAKGKTATDAMIAAGAIRLRPILMTACATVAGILPIAIGFGAGGEARRPMGVATVGGMITSTFLTLFVIPVVYVWFSKVFQNKKKIAPAVMILLLSGVFLNGCASSREYVPPEVATPKQWKQTTAAAVSVLPEQWWTVFNDSTLNDLEDKSLANNQDLKAAVANVDKARAIARVSEADLFPIIGATPSAVRSRTSKNSSVLFNKSRTSNEFTIPLDFSYEIDLWGKVRKSFESGRFEAYAQKYAYETVLLTLTSDVANQYFLLRQLDAQVYALSETVKLRTEVVKILSDRVSAGLSSELDLSQAKTEMARVEAQIIEAKRLRERGENALSLLCGQSAQEFHLLSVEDYHLKAPSVPVGLPSDLLRHRPDVMQAQELMASANAKVGVAKADFFPSITLNAAAGLQTMDAAKLFQAASGMWSVGPSITIPLFNAGGNQAKLKAARAEYEKTLAQYHQVILKSFTEVEDALVDVNMQEQESKAQERLFNSANATKNMSYERYRQGLVSFIDVVDAERSRLEAQLSLIQSQTQRLIACVNLIKSLGGANPEVSSN